MYVATPLGTRQQGKHVHLLLLFVSWAAERSGRFDGGATTMAWGWGRSSQESQHNQQEEEESMNATLSRLKEGSEFFSSGLTGQDSAGFGKGGEREREGEMSIW